MRGLGKGKWGEEEGGEADTKNDNWQLVVK